MAKNYPIQVVQGDDSIGAELLNLAMKFNIPYAVLVFPIGMVKGGPELPGKDELQGTPAPGVIGIGCDVTFQAMAEEIAIITRDSLIGSMKRIFKAVDRANTEKN